MDDWKLLRDYAEHGSEAAFQGLVRRHVDMVHAAALRQLRDPHQAQDVTQAVFILLARKASSLKSSVILSGWLYRTTSHVASRALRDRIRQQRREQEAAMMIANEPADELWEKLAPHLDAAIGTLGDTDRDAVVLRFLQQRSFREVAGALGVTEDAAKKRVTRALEKLRAHLTTRGIAVTGALLAGALEANAASAAPAAVVIAASAASTGAASVAAAGLAGAIARAWWFARLKWATGLAGSMAVVALVVAPAGFFPRPPAQSEPAEIQVVAPAASGVTVEAMPATAATLAAPTHDARTMRLQVLSARDNSPLAEARAQLTFYGLKFIGAKVTANTNGVLEIIRPDRPYQGMAFWVAAPGHVPKCLSWKREEEFSLPADYQVTLDPGRHASGRVVDEAGQPVAGARLRFNSEGMQWNARDYVDYRHPPFVPTSDAHGEWAVDFLAARPRVSGYVQHPDFAETEMSFALPESGASNVTVTLRKGTAIAGVLLGANHAPLADATVTVDWQHSTRETIKTTTDYWGQFHFPHVTPSRLRLKFSAPGHHALEQWHELSPSGLALTNALTPVKVAGDATVRGQVVDEAGAPIPGINVSLAHGQPDLAGVSWSATTDDAGRFVWSQAPEDGARLNFTAWQYQHLYDVKLTSGDEHIVTLKAAATSQLRCFVTDKTSGQPVPRFKVMHGTRDLTFRHATDGLGMMDFAGEGVDGFFAFPWWPQNASLGRLKIAVLRVEAEGYEPGTVAITNVPGREAEVAVQLEPAHFLEGVVWTPAGTPGIGAELALIGGSLRVTLQEPTRFLSAGPDPHQHRTKTGSDGGFRISSRREANRLVVVHDQGCAIIPLENFTGGNVVLQPWGRIEGVLKIGQQPGADREVTVSGVVHEAGYLTFSFRAKTDAAGQFVFAKVPPGQAQAGHWMLTPFSRDGTGFTTVTQQRAVEVKAGETTRVTVGGAGVQVRGRLTLETPRSDAAFELAAQNLRPAGVEPDPTWPPRGYGFFCQPDGSFVIEDIPPGRYVLEVRVHAVKERHNPEAAFNGFSLGERKIEVIVPENQSAALDLGDVSVPTRQDALPLGVH